MALGKAGDIGTVSYLSGTHYCVVLSKPDSTHNIVALKLGATKDRITWGVEYTTTAVTVLSSTDALHE